MSLHPNTQPRVPTPSAKGSPSEVSSLHLSNNKTTSSPKSRTLPQTPTAPPHPSQAGTLPMASGGITPPWSTCQLPKYQGTLTSLSLSGHLKAFVERKGSQPGHGPCLLEIDKELTGPSGSGEQGHQKRGVSAPCLNTHQTLALRHVLHGKRTGLKKGAGSQGLSQERGVSGAGNHTREVALQKQ